MCVCLTFIPVLNVSIFCPRDGGSGDGGFGRDSGDEDVSVAGVSGTGVMVCRSRAASANRWAAERSRKILSRYTSTSSAMSKGLLKGRWATLPRERRDSSVLLLFYRLISASGKSQV